MVFEIRYKPGYHLKVRMGIHVGPCVAGLTGTVLPSYSLIGEAVENAKLMEATGEPMKIQVVEIITLSCKVLSVYLISHPFSNFTNPTKYHADDGIGSR